MPSVRLQKLSRHIDELRRDLLPTPFVDTGIYQNPDEVNTRTVAFVSLVHAEFEAYFEDRAEEVATTARDSFIASAHVSRTAICLLGFSAKAGWAPGKKLTAVGGNRDDVDIKARVKVAGDEYLGALRKNNGIKEKNLSAILLPIGFEYFSIDNLLITSLNDLGGARGGFVHRGKDTHVTANLDPKTQYDDMSKLVRRLEKMDDEFEALLAGSRLPGVSVG